MRSHYVTFTVEIIVVVIIVAVGVPHVMRDGQDGAAVQQDLDDLIVVAVGGQDEGCDVRGKVGSVGRDCLPTLKSRKKTSCQTHSIGFPMLHYKLLFNFVFTSGFELTPIIHFNGPF